MWKSVGGPRIREKVALERFSCLVCYPLFSILGGRRTFLYRGCKQKRGASIVGQDVSAIRNEPKHAVIKDVSWCNIEKSFHSPTQNIRASANHSNLLDMDGFQAAGNVFLTFHCIFQVNFESKLYYESKNFQKTMDYFWDNFSFYLFPCRHI